MTRRRKSSTKLRDLLEYANHFHHDTNPAYETVRINDAELRGFVVRTLTFTRRYVGGRPLRATVSRIALDTAAGIVWANTMFRKVRR